MTLPIVKRDGMVNLLYLLLSVTVLIYITTRWLFTFICEMLEDGSPLVAETLMDAFMMHCSICDVPRADYRRHMKGIPQSILSQCPVIRGGDGSGKTTLFL